MAATLLAALPKAAEAHVKWFTPTSVHDLPKTLPAVLSGAFPIILGVAILLVLLGFLLDGWIARHWPKILSSGHANAGIEQRLIRAATGAYFIGVSDTGGVILTPELHSGAGWIRIVQFLIAFALVWRRTCVVAGLFILLLYADAIRRYGMFHLVDYVFIPGLAFYLASLTLRSLPLARWRESVLTGSLAFSLAWTAIEKFLYPQWTAAVVLTHPSIALGLPVPLVTIIAGFVEFTLAFYLVTGRGLLRLGGLGYAAIFAAAMPAFGRLDVFGHLIIIAILGIVVLRGTTPMQDRLHVSGGGLALDAAWIAALYVLALGVFFALYYAMQRS